MLSFEVIEHACGKKAHAVSCVDTVEPSKVVEIRGDVFDVPTFRQECIAHRDHVWQIDVEDFACAVVAVFRGLIESAAQVYQCCVRVRGKVILRFDHQICFTHGNLQRTETVRRALCALFKRREIVVDPIDQFDRLLVAEQIRELLCAELASVQRDHQCFLHGVWFDMRFHGLLLSDQQCGALKLHPRRFSFADKRPVIRVDQPDVLIAHVSEFFRKCLHIAVSGF